MVESILSGKRLLAVDDEPDILETLKEHLEDTEGLVLDVATDYETGYHLIRSWTYDIVILDIMGVRGFDLLNAAVALGYPSVMLTAHALTPEALRKSVELGARAFLPKEKMSDIVSFLEDVLTTTHQKGWRRVFDRLGVFFSRTFGAEWQKDEKEFWDVVVSGKYNPEPVILKK
jgi:DNA-binding response OmpR family regulator